MINLDLRVDTLFSPNSIATTIIPNLCIRNSERMPCRYTLSKLSTIIYYNYK